MKLEHQVCSLELAQKLKALGVPQESLFYWSDSDIYTDEKGWTVNYRSKVTKRDGVELDWYSAFTVAELGEMLKPNTKSFQSYDEEGMWCAWHTDVNFKAKTEADARAKMLICLIENNLLDVKNLAPNK